MSLRSTQHATAAGDKRMPNLVLLGAALSNLAPKKSFVLEAIKNTVPKKVLEINQKAFAAGRAQGK